MIERIQTWVESLTESQMKEVCTATTLHLIFSGDVRFHDHAKRPYWKSRGNSLDGCKDIWTEKE